MKTMDLAFSYAENIAEIRDSLNKLMTAPVHYKIVFIDDLLKINERLTALEEVLKFPDSIIARISNFK